MSAAACAIHRLRFPGGLSLAVTALLVSASPVWAAGPGQSIPLPAFSSASVSASGGTPGGLGGMEKGSPAGHSAKEPGDGPGGWDPAEETDAASDTPSGAASGTAPGPVGSPGSAAPEPAPSLPFDDLPGPSGKPAVSEPASSSPSASGSHQSAPAEEAGDARKGGKDKKGGGKSKADGRDDKGGAGQARPRGSKPAQDRKNTAGEAAGKRAGSATALPVESSSRTASRWEVQSLSPSGTGGVGEAGGRAGAGLTPGNGQDSASSAGQPSTGAVAEPGRPPSGLLPFGTGLALIGLGAALLGFRMRHS